MTPYFRTCPVLVRFRSKIIDEEFIKLTFFYLHVSVTCIRAFSRLLITKVRIPAGKTGVEGKGKPKPTCC